MSEEKDLVMNLTSELRRGTLILSVLSQLKEEKYGYALVQALEEKGVAIDANTLYPLLRRLEKQGLLHSEWEMGESKPRKYYKRTDLGDDIYRKLRVQWTAMAETLNQLIKEE